MPNKTKKYQLLLHIGLPKTASTTLQHNVFFQLDQAGKINFLSRKSANNILYSSKNIDDLKLETNKLLTTNKLNVLSNENFSHSVNYNSADVFCKLKTIFDDCEIKLLVSLRSPMDFIFSYYVEQYCCNFYADKQNNSFPGDMTPMFETIIEKVAAPEVDISAP
ncbi:MAG: hypothetical protein HAW58_02110, partial [Candidatus Thioglobus sp.]|nr:hypothetical protein [Candidatus Thioglobus sp.]